MMKNFRTKNHALRTRRAFTMIELLVVIAIIAILAAILFPVFALVREQARQSSTMSNMQAIYVAAKLFNEDEGHYPAVLYGYAEVNDPNLTPPYRPAKTGEKATPMNDIAGTYATASGGVLNGYLYHEQIKDYVTFLAGDDDITDKTATTVAYLPPNVPGSKTSINNGVVSGTPVSWNYSGTHANGCATYDDPDYPADKANYPVNTPKLFYKMDAMDIGPMIDGNGNVVKDTNKQVAYELHYSPDWTHELWQAKTCDVDPVTKLPLVGQMKYKNPPTDHTILTYVTSHVGFGHSQKVLVLLLSGTARKMEAKDAFTQMPLNFRP